MWMTRWPKCFSLSPCSFHSPHEGWGRTVQTESGAETLADGNHPQGRGSVRTRCGRYKHIPAACAGPSRMEITPKAGVCAHPLRAIQTHPCSLRWSNAPSSERTARPGSEHEHRARPCPRRPSRTPRPGLPERRPNKARCAAGARPSRCPPRDRRSALKGPARCHTASAWLRRHGRAAPFQPAPSAGRPAAAPRAPARGSRTPAPPRGRRAGPARPLLPARPL